MATHSRESSLAPNSHQNVKVHWSFFLCVCRFSVLVCVLSHLIGKHDERPATSEWSNNKKNIEYGEFAIHIVLCKQNISQSDGHRPSQWLWRLDLIFVFFIRFVSLFKFSFNFESFRCSSEVDDSYVRRLYQILIESAWIIILIRFFFAIRVFDLELYVCVERMVGHLSVGLTGVRTISIF